MFCEDEEPKEVRTTIEGEPITEPKRRKRGRPKGAKNKNPRVGYDKMGHKLQAQAYKEFLDSGDISAIEPNDIVACIEVIRNRRSRHSGKGVGSQGKYEHVEDLSFAIEAYWDFIAVSWAKGIDVIPDIEGVASFIGVSRNTMREWELRNYKNFAQVLAQLRTDIASTKKQLALRGKIPPVVFATDFNNNHDYVQKQEVAITPTPYVEQISTEDLKKKYLDNVKLSAIEVSKEPLKIDSTFQEVKQENI